jgi:hypothetical protein
MDEQQPDSAQNDTENETNEYTVLRSMHNMDDQDG